MPNYGLIDKPLNNKAIEHQKPKPDDLKIHPGDRPKVYYIPDDLIGFLASFPRTSGHSERTVQMLSIGLLGRPLGTKARFTSEARSHHEGGESREIKESVERGRRERMIVDAHTHLFDPKARSDPRLMGEKEPVFELMFGRGKARMADPEAMLGEMREAGVDAAVLCPFPWITLQRCAENNDYLLEVARTYPGRFIPLAVTNPRWGKAAVKEARRCLDAGARGLGELHGQPQGFDPGDVDTMKPLMRLALEYEVPLLIHVNEPVGHIYPGKGPVTPQVIYPLIKSFPEVKLVLAHWGGGLPFYELMPEVSRECANVFYDTSASPFLYRPEIYDLVVKICGADKILFATDYPLLPFLRCMEEVTSKLDGETRHKVLGENAVRLFGPP